MLLGGGRHLKRKFRGGVLVGEEQQTQTTEQTTQQQDTQQDTATEQLEQLQQQQEQQFETTAQKLDAMIEIQSYEISLLSFLVAVALVIAYFVGKGSGHSA